MVVKNYEWISLQLNHAGESKRKTNIWDCFSKRGQHLGVVKWWAHWRRYCFLPDSSMVFDCNCLWDIADFCAMSAKEQKARP